jgi:hypothetical protein
LFFYFFTFFRFLSFGGPGGEAPGRRQHVFAVSPAGILGFDHPFGQKIIPPFGKGGPGGIFREGQKEKL